MAEIPNDDFSVDQENQGNFRGKHAPRLLTGEFEKALLILLPLLEELEELKKESTSQTPLTEEPNNDKIGSS